MEITTKYRWVVLWALFAFHCSLFTSQTVAQTAKAVLDKTASVVSNKSGAKASFTIKGDQMNASGTIAIKGRKFQAATPQASIWFDGKTQWTYLKKNDEVLAEVLEGKITPSEYREKKREIAKEKDKKFSDSRDQHDKEMRELRNSYTGDFCYMSEWDRY